MALSLEVDRTIYVREITRILNSTDTSNMQVLDEDVWSLYILALAQFGAPGVVPYLNIAFAFNCTLFHVPYEQLEPRDD